MEDELEVAVATDAAPVDLPRPREGWADMALSMSAMEDPTLSCLSLELRPLSTHRTAQA